MNFCSQCGAPVSSRVPPGDDRARYVCDSCGTIFYSNPKIVAGCIPQWGEQVLLCRRAIEPRSGLWTVPAGFMENGESTAQAAARETLEEANARVEIGKLFAYLNIPAINQVYVIFLARLLDIDYSAGAESLEVRLFDEHQIPWEEIAFPSIERALRFYYQDRHRQSVATHMADIEPRPR
jgi:ADP-ribose pyrophosphatase YjhB (NUDIX family)